MPARLRRIDDAASASPLLDCGPIPAAMTLVALQAPRFMLNTNA
jgi:hypothetical protein